MGSTALAISGDKIPAHINLQSTRGNENVGTNVEIPRIKLLALALLLSQNGLFG